MTGVQTCALPICRLVNAFDDGLLLEAEREGRLIKIFVPYDSIKCVEVFDI